MPLILMEPITYYLIIIIMSHSFFSSPWLSCLSYQICEFMYEKKHLYDKIISCYLKDPIRKVGSGCLWLVPYNFSWPSPSLIWTRPGYNTLMFRIKILFYTLLSLSGILEPMQYSQKVQTPSSGQLLVGSVVPGKIIGVQKSIWIPSES